MDSYTPTPLELKTQLSKTDTASFCITKARQTIKELISKNDKRIALIVGPCSIHDKNSALEYGKRLKELSLEIEDSCFLIMRAYMEKSRTQLGWKGLAYDPYLDDSHKIDEGLFLARETLLELSELELPLATEIVDPLVFSYYEDLISWGFIGARTVSSQIHRQAVSKLSLPVGFKNGIDGDTESAFQAIQSARHRHTYLSLNEQGLIQKTTSNGNPFTHLVLRGSKQGPNYPQIDQILHSQFLHEIHSRILVDCSHGNSGKIADYQIFCFDDVLEKILSGNTNILGLMLESFLEKGKQKITSGKIHPNISVTDACLDFETTKELILSAAKKLRSSSIMQK
ncbi:MAG: 3-deoxy-7-phosphoheptulonate synthase [Chlamydiae bacterium]|nr:3-deoxy-7-phosphoheptulonate synthase [Chlamydiota bacterium]